MTDETRRSPAETVSHAPATVLAILWEWSDGPHKGARFWGCHSMQNDGRIRDWPSQNLRPLGAAKVEVIEGQGLELLPSAAAPSATKPLTDTHRPEAK